MLQASYGQSEGALTPPQHREGVLGVCESRMGFFLFFFFFFFNPLADFTSLLRASFKQEKERKSIKVLTKGLPGTEGTHLDSGTSGEASSRFSASLSYSRPAGPADPTRPLVSIRAQSSDLAAASFLPSLQALPLTQARPPRAQLFRDSTGTKPGLPSVAGTPF